MFGMALANPAGLQIDFLGRVFGLRFLAGLFLLIATYGFYSLKQYAKQTKSVAHHNKEVHRFSKQLLLQKMQKANDAELVQLLVAYLEKFTTKTKRNSLGVLFQEANFSLAEIQQLQEANYGKGKLSAELKEKIVKRCAINTSW